MLLFKKSSGSLESEDKLVRIMIMFLLISVITAFNMFEPEQLSFTECRFKSITGLSCPTCGITRSLHAAANLDFIDSVMFNPVGLLIYISVLLLLVKCIYEISIKRKLEITRTLVKPKIFLSSILGFWSVFWIARLLIEA